MSPKESPRGHRDKQALDPWVIFGILDLNSLSFCFILFLHVIIYLNVLCVYLNATVAFLKYILKADSAILVPKSLSVSIIF